MKHPHRLGLRLAGALALGLALSGCASGPRVVSSQVHTVSAQAPGDAVLVQARYRFAVTPAAPEPGQMDTLRLQRLAEAALARHGLVHDEAGARLNVEVTGRVQAYWLDAWGRPYGSLSRMTFGIGVARGGWGFGLGGPLWMDDGIPVYVSELAIIMRDVQSGQIVYDSRARHDGRWHNTDAVLEALLTAALEGFPNPPQGTRRVEVPILPAGAGQGGALTPPVLD